VLVTDQAVAIHLYRIAQEAVSNALKHGKAGRIEINLTASANAAALAVTDNGVGLPRKPRKRTGMGLRIMRYRAEVIGGTLSAEPLPGGGTRVVCTLPEALLTRQSRSTK